jgi:hypothetical protein
LLALVALILMLSTPPLVLAGLPRGLPVTTHLTLPLDGVTPTGVVVHGLVHVTTHAAVEGSLTITLNPAGVTGASTTGTPYIAVGSAHTSGPFTTNPPPLTYTLTLIRTGPDPSHSHPPALLPLSVVLFITFSDTGEVLDATLLTATS